MNYAAQISRDGHLLAKSPHPPKQRKPMKKVSKKRGAALKEYAKRRRRFLKERPWCEAWTAIYFYHKKHGIDMPSDAPRTCPPSSEIHHTKKPRNKYLNVESTWLAVSRWSHDFIENHKSIARQIGLLQ